MKIAIKNELNKIDRNLQWLSNKAEISYTTLHRLANNKTTSISFEVIEKICNVLNCTPNDIMKLEHPNN